MRELAQAQTVEGWSETDPEVRAEWGLALEPQAE
jgi:hypothetical protein